MASTDRVKPSQRIVIIGAQSGGLAFLSHARRFSEDAQITLLERGQNVAYAACGLAHHIGCSVRDRSTLLSGSAQEIASYFRANIHLCHEALTIDRDAKCVHVRNLACGEKYALPYDKLVLATGARPKLPSGIFGLECLGVHTLRSIEDMGVILASLHSTRARHVTVVGAGAIGLQAADKFRHRGLAVTLLEQSGQVMHHLDRELAALLQREVIASGICLELNTSVRGFSDLRGRTQVHLDNGEKFTTDLVFLATGKEPNASLAMLAGLKIGRLDGIVVDEYLRTSDQDIYAVGDVAESRNRVTGEAELVQLAVPVAKQARVAAAHMLVRTTPYCGTLGTFAWRLFGLTVAASGLSEKRLKAASRAYEKVFIPSSNLAPFFPGAKELYVKLLFATGTGQLLGVQAVGEDAEKRIDVLASAISGGLSVHDLEDLELAYSPHFSSPKDVVIQAGSMASWMLQGASKVVHPEDLVSKCIGCTVLDIRSVDEYFAGTIPGALHMPAERLRDRLGELPKDCMLVIFCQVGSKSHTIQRTLELLGYKAASLMGGYVGWSLWHNPSGAAAQAQVRAGNIHPDRRLGLNRRYANERRSCVAGSGGFADRRERTERRGNADRRHEWLDPELDVRDLACPGPIERLKDFVQQVPPGGQFKVCASDANFPHDFMAWCNHSGHTVERVYISSTGSIAYCTKAAGV